ncbi:hypothetical protein K2173_009149 [Erythroxylum novogranatense]|uniref:GAG-pre-integrase domain-containing protein n=1 Tax=Erythroxylum novogranatense TaxID=1862640 RepID=A0AAV8TDB1_9ROSI|nr:hypothetical protein K2173_009149 [Erythroxylum novogranatense]
MQVLNLIREFELQKMKESETVKEYSDRLLKIVNKVRLLGNDFSDSRVVQKIIVTAPKKYEASITTLENTRDLSKITLAKLLNSLQAQEQRRLMRHNDPIEGALQAKHQNSSRGKGRNLKGNYPPCKHCDKLGHPPYKCWRRPDRIVICRDKSQKQEADAQVADQDEEDQMFVATCFSTKTTTESWLIDSGCTNHMTFDKTLFKDLKPTKIAKVRIGNGDYISAKGKGAIAITTISVSFENLHCLVYDATGELILRVKMRGKSFSFDPTEEEHVAYLYEINITEIWHKRLGHCHIQRMLEMKKNEMTRGLPILVNQLPNCHACHFGKQNRLPFPKSTWRATQKLQLIHTDVAGP